MCIFYKYIKKKNTKLVLDANPFKTLLNDQKKKDKRTNNDLQNTTQKTKVAQHKSN